MFDKIFERIFGPQTPQWNERYVHLSYFVRQKSVENSSKFWRLGQGQRVTNKKTKYQYKNQDTITQNNVKNSILLIIIILTTINVVAIVIFLSRSF